MAMVYFHYSNDEGTLVDRRGADMTDIAAACEHATCMVHSLIATPNAEDWRGWILHASDDLGEELFAMPFSSVLGKPH